MAKNQFLNWGKSLKLPNMQFHEKNFFWFIWFHEFFAWTFLNFLAHCVKSKLLFSEQIMFFNIKKCTNLKYFLGTTYFSEICGSSLYQRSVHTSNLGTASTQWCFDCFERRRGRRPQKNNRFNHQQRSERLFAQKNSHFRRQNFW